MTPTPDPQLDAACLDRLGRMAQWPRVKAIVQRLEANGFAAFLVGGVVRDLLFGLAPKDVDLLTNAAPDEIQTLFRDQDVRYVGKAFSISLVNGVDVASCRSESATHPDSGGSSAGETDAPTFPARDLAFRDFTMNSMALDLSSMTLIDPFGGARDIARKQIRFTRKPDQRIAEDPLRMVRACRFAAAYSARIDPLSLAAIQTHRERIGAGAAQERIQAELLRAMEMDTPSLFFRRLHETGLLALILPCLDRCFDLDGGPHHGETVFDHCLMVGDALPASQPVLRLAGYLHDVGKFDAAQIKDGQLTFFGHETFQDALKSDLDRLKFSSRDKKELLSLVSAHMRPLNHETTPKAVRRLLAMLADLDLGFEDFFRLRIADKKSNLLKSPYTLSEMKVRIKKVRQEQQSHAAFSINDLKISGRQICAILNIPPGPRVGQVKAMLFEKVLEDPGLNTADKLAELVQAIQ